ncbi:MAG: glycerate kinase [Burkholderiales bacterium]|nr:glycerate kinase [Burkholderiales bacterium]
MIDPRQFLAALFAAATTAAQPAHCLPLFLPPAPNAGRIIVIGAGKAAAAMARVVELHYPHSDISGLVVTRYGHQVPCEKIRVVQAAHPVPDQAGMQAAQEILSLVANLTSEDVVLCLISGGGSALLALPAGDITLAQKQEINRALLISGATISEMNCVRKHLSAIKGGRLALAVGPAQLHTLLISDVPGDDPATIASGPTLADATTRQQALAICAKYEIALPATVLAWLESEQAETPKPSAEGVANPFAHHHTHVIASSQQALQAAARLAQQSGLHPYILSDSVEGEARDVALVHAALVQQTLRTDGNEFCPFKRPCLLLSGGETTVTVDGQGRGGRNSEFLLALAIALNGAPQVFSIACDTDGIDGSENNAGAICGPETLQRASALGLNASAHLANNDAYGFFAALGDLVITGPSLTNVNDFRAILIL